MINNVTIVGRIASKIELRFAASGTAVVNLFVAVNRPTKESEADFFTVVVFGKAAENAAEFLEKGQEVGIVGHLMTRSWAAEDGRNVRVVEIVADQLRYGAKPRGRSDAQPQADVSAPVEPVPALEEAF